MIVVKYSDPKVILQEQVDICNYSFNFNHLRYIHLMKLYWTEWDTWLWLMSSVTIWTCKLWKIIIPTGTWNPVPSLIPNHRNVINVIYLSGGNMLPLSSSTTLPSCLPRATVSNYLENRDVDYYEKMYFLTISMRIHWRY